MEAERYGKVLIFGDGASVYIKEGETFCWHSIGEPVYPLHENEGQALGVHLWGSSDGFLNGTLDIWDIKKDGANNNERFVLQCEKAIEAFEVMFPGKQGLIVNSLRQQCGSTFKRV